MIPSDPLLVQAERSSPDVAAVIMSDSTVTYSDLADRARRMASSLLDIGVTADDRVAIFGGIDLDTVVAIHACWACGATPVPLDPTIGAERCTDRVERIDADTVLMTSEASPGLPGTTSIEALHDPDRVKDVSASIIPDASAVILFTSGTTGSPSAVPLTWVNLYASAISSALRLGHDPADRWAVCLQPYHMGGFAPLVRAAIYGTGIVLGSPSSQSISRAVDTHGATGISLVPTLLERAIEDDVPLDQYETVLVGGDRTPRALVRRAIERDISLYCTYGMTEAASQIATATPADLQIEAQTTGRPLHWTQVSVDPTGEVDELVVRGPTISPGYLGETDSARFTSDGGLRTGDIGYLDDAGRLFVTGRVADRIVTGGVTVDARSIATMIERHAAVDTAVVIGIPDDTWGECVGAVLKTDGTSPAEILHDLDDTLSSAERPRTVISVNQVPRTESGTVDRRAVRDLLED